MKYGTPVTPSEYEAQIKKLLDKQRKKFNPQRQALINRYRLKIAVAEQEGVGHSEAEFYFRKLAEEKGWTLFKRGWPDFLCLRNGEVVFVEVKNGRDNVSESQRKVLNILSGLGLKCYVWRPTKGFVRWKILEVAFQGRVKEQVR